MAAPTRDWILTFSQKLRVDLSGRKRPSLQCTLYPRLLRLPKLSSKNNISNELLRLSGLITCDAFKISLANSWHCLFAFQYSFTLNKFVRTAALRPHSIFNIFHCQTFRNLNNLKKFLTLGTFLAR